MSKTMREILTEQRSALVEELNTLIEAAETEERLATDEEESRQAEIVNDVRSLDEKLKKIDEQDELRKQRGAGLESAGLNPAKDPAPGVVTHQERTYTTRNKSMFLSDLFAFSYGGLRPDQSVRLATHEKEARDRGQFDKRAASTSTFAGIIPPQFLVDQYALVARAGRPTANTTFHLPLGDTGMTVYVPRSTTGVTTGVQSSENSAVSTQDQVWTNLSIPVVTIGAYNDVSRQSLDRADGVDDLVFADLAASYAVTLDQQVLSGTGSAGQALGILATAGINQATAFGAAATVTTFLSKLAGQINAIQTTRYAAPNVIIMHPRRWNWLVSQVDSTGRPLVSPHANSPFNAIGVYDAPVDTPAATPVGEILGLPVITDASIPTSVGTGPEDQVILARREDMLLWEDPAAPFTLRFDQTVGTNLTVRLVAYGYMAFTAGRYPAGIGVVGGNAGTAGFGLVAPTF